MNPDKPVIKGHENQTDWQEATKNETDANFTLRHLVMVLNQVGSELTKETRILEIGSGKGEFVKYLQNEGYDIVGVDANPRHTDNLPIANVRGEFLPFNESDPKQRFDLVVGIALLDQNVYEQDISQMLSEMSRVLEVGGLVYLYSSLIDRDELKNSLPTNLKILVYKAHYLILEKIAD